ncbi:multicopper oxidase domain-containing protein [Xanthobacter autotrophicus DSM 431]|uniref:multicopper oxidase family protein n=1 Tax=Xanthobacter nonsaccharivorans TaxID=3119912 RepID=UPI00372B8610
MTSMPAFPSLTRRSLLAGGAAMGALALAGRWSSARAEPLLTVDTAVLEVNGKPAKVFTVRGPSGDGLFAKAGERLAGPLLNATDLPLVMHWHGQVLAPPEEDRARPGGGALSAGATDFVNFELTPGTHWMHSHTLSEQQLLAAPLVTREDDAGDVQDVVVMLHDFSFRTPQEILAGLGGGTAPGGHGAHGAATPAAPAARGNAMAGMDHSAHGASGAGAVMVHANDVAYDAFLANRRTLADPEVVQVEKGARVRLRLINGGTATAFFISVPDLRPRCVAVDGSPCEPLGAEVFPLAQGQRIDLVVRIPATGGAFPVLAQVEGSDRRTGVVLATAGAAIPRVAETADTPQGLIDLGFEGRLAASRPLDEKPADRVFPVMLGEESGYRWTINGATYAEGVAPFAASSGERVEMTFMNPTAMSHPMHLHGHHFQVVGIGGKRFPGPVRDTVLVPPQVPVTIAFDAGQKGEWYLHCHHLYHMAAGMMSVLKVA